MLLYPTLNKFFVIIIIIIIVIMAANAPRFWAHLIEMHQGVHSAS